MTVSWNALSPLLKADGFCVFALDYGDRATAPMEQSADQLAAFARRVLSATGAAKVSFVGPLPGRLARAADRALPRAAEPDGGRRRPRALQSRDDEPARAPGRGPLLPGLPGPAGRLAGDAAPQRAAGGADGGRLDRGVDALRRGRDALPLAGPRRGRRPRTSCSRTAAGSTSPTTSGSSTTPRRCSGRSNALRRDGPADPAFRPACV